SMGEEDKREERLRLLIPYQVNQALMNSTGRKDTIFLHCLPAVKGEEVTPDVIDGPQSRAWDEAENRKHTIKAIMLATM
ncbi:MAG: ornithine carbamoyltransferase, partial [Spirochaetaceae bacterium]|nr:ornithine carbamoyltransferase [Spirochaetaceae bacterium]